MVNPSLWNLLLWLSMGTYVRCFSYRSRISAKLSTTSRQLWKRQIDLQAAANLSTTDDNTCKKKVVFLGTPDVAADCLKTIYDASVLDGSPFEISTVVTQPAARRKRKGKIEGTPVGKLAEELGITVLTPSKANEKEFLDSLAALKPDLCITAAYGQYLPKRFLSTPKHGTVNIHPSLLPRWRGASPVQRSLEAGENPLGCTVLFTVSEMDAGPILAQQEMSVSPADTATTVLPALFDVGTQLLLKQLPEVLSGNTNMESALVQDDSKVVNASMISTTEGELKLWKESAETCHNRLRGFSMWPGVYMWFKVGDRDTMKVKIIQSRLPDISLESTDVIKPGPSKKDGLYVVAHDGSVLELLVIQPVTRKAFPARDFSHGYPGETIRWVETPAD